MQYPLPSPQSSHTLTYVSGVCWFQLSIQYNIPHENNWKTLHSGRDCVSGSCTSSQTDLGLFNHLSQGNSGWTVRVILCSMSSMHAETQKLSLLFELYVHFVLFCAFSKSRRIWTDGAVSLVVMRGNVVISSTRYDRTRRRSFKYGTLVLLCPSNGCVA